MPRAKSSPRNRVTYSVHPSVPYAKAIIDNLPTKTGKSIEEWLNLLIATGHRSSQDIRAFLKSEYGLGGTTASLIAGKIDGKEIAQTDPELYLKTAAVFVEEMYSGPKETLRPIYNALINLGLSLGRDVRICPCKTIVPLYRNHVFSEIKPTTRTRIDFGLALKGVKREIPKRLLPTGGLEKGDRITHRFPLASLNEIDREVTEWLRIAYDLDSK